MYLQCRRKGGGTPRRKGDFRALAVEMPRLDDLARGYRGRLDWCTLLLPWEIPRRRNIPARPSGTYPPGGCSCRFLVLVPGAPGGWAKVQAPATVNERNT